MKNRLFELSLPPMLPITIQIRIQRESEADTTLNLPALETTSFIQAGKRNVAALHLEAKPCFRILKNDHSVSGEGLVLGNAIAEVLLSKVNL